VKDEFVRSCTVVRVIDGDTVELIVDLGFRVETRIHLRLEGIDAPELSTPMGKIARAQMQALTIGTGTLGTLRSSGDEGKYGGTWIGDLLIGTLDVAGAMLAGGYAHPYGGKGPRKAWSVDDPYPIPR